MATRMRGATPSPRHKMAAARTFEPRVPIPQQFIWPWIGLSMWNNDVDGCCTVSEECFAKACQPGGVYITDSNAKAWGTQYGFEDGAVIIDVIEQMQRLGFQEYSATYDDGAPVSVDWTNAANLTAAIAAGPVKIGVAADALEAVVGSTNGWLLEAAPIDTNYDHCVSLCGYGTIAWLQSQLGGTVGAGIDGARPGYALFTWSTVGIIDVESLLAITCEAWLRQPTTIVIPA